MNKTKSKARTLYEKELEKQVWKRDEIIERLMKNREILNEITYKLKNDNERIRRLIDIL